MDRGWWWSAVDCYSLNEEMLKKMLDLIWNKNYNLEVVTWMPDEAVPAIRERLDDESIPVRDVLSSNPGRLSRQLAYMPWVSAVYDADPAHVLTYGSKGVHLTDINKIGRS